MVVGVKVGLSSLLYHMHNCTGFMMPYFKFQSKHVHRVYHSRGMPHMKLYFFFFYPRLLAQNLIRKLRSDNCRMSKLTNWMPAHAFQVPL